MRLMQIFKIVFLMKKKNSVCRFVHNQSDSAENLHTFLDLKTGQELSGLNRLVLILSLISRLF